MDGRDDSTGGERVVPGPRLRIRHGDRDAGGDVEVLDAIEVDRHLLYQRTVLRTAHDPAERHLGAHSGHGFEQDGERCGGRQGVRIRVVVGEHEKALRVFDRFDQRREPPVPLVHVAGHPSEQSPCG